MNEVKTVKGLEEALAVFEAHVPKRYWGYSVEAIQEAIAMLKAQEPVAPVIESHWETPSVYDDDVKVTENKCGACGTNIDKWDKFCKVCGRAVKWE